MHMTVTARMRASVAPLPGWLHGSLDCAVLVALLLSPALGCSCGGKPSLSGDGGELDAGIEDGVVEAADSEDLPYPDEVDEDTPDHDAADVEEEEEAPPVYWSGSYAYCSLTQRYAATSLDGYFFSETCSLHNGVVVKLDGMGQPSWCMSYEGILDYHIRGLRQFVGEAGFHAFGEVSSDYMSDVWIMEADASGAILWQKMYRHVYGEEAISVIRTIDGGYIVAGYTFSFGEGYQDALLLRLDGEGEILWQFCYGSERREGFTEVLSAPGGGFLAAGTDFWIVAVDDSGGIEWQKSYGEATDSFVSFDACPGGGYIAAGLTESFGMGGTDFLVVRIDESGGVLWQKSYGTGEDEEGGFVAATADGGFILAGYSWPTLRGLLLRLDAVGGIVWRRSYGLEGIYHHIDGVEELAGGGFFAWGMYWDADAPGDVRTWLLKTDPDGLISPDCPPGFAAEASLVSSDTDVTVTETDAVRTPTELWALDGDAVASECGPLLAETICDSW
jgi:hypothetical protein